MNKAIIVLLMMFSSSVFADSIDINLTSYHSDKTYDYNSSNYGIGYTKSLKGHYSVSAGGFRNSYDKTSLYLMFGISHKMSGWKFGIKGGVASGYSDIETGSQETINTYGNRHDDDNHHRDTRYKRKIETHTHVKNMNEIQFVVMPTLTWNMDTKNALEFTYLPDFNNGYVITAQYQYTL